MATKLNVVEMSLPTDAEDADQLMPAAIEAPLAGIALDPHYKVRHLSVGLFAGVDELPYVPPVNAHKVNCTFLGVCCHAN
jgi:hypothetical protein